MWIKEGSSVRGTALPASSKRTFAFAEQTFAEPVAEAVAWPGSGAQLVWEGGALCFLADAQLLPFNETSPQWTVTAICEGHGVLTLGIGHCPTVSPSFGSMLWESSRLSVPGPSKKPLSSPLPFL